MMQTLATHRANRYQDRGDGLVEFALILPVLMLVLMGIVDLGRGVYAYNVVANSAREGARYGVASPSDTIGMINAAKVSAVGLDPNRITVTINKPTSDTLRVGVSYDFRLVTPLIAQALSGRSALQLSSQATMYTGY
jgi:Flp pilus assembly protein TadG